MVRCIMNMAPEIWLSKNVRFQVSIESRGWYGLLISPFVQFPVRKKACYGRESSSFNDDLLRNESSTMCFCKQNSIIFSKLKDFSCDSVLCTRINSIWTSIWLVLITVSWNWLAYEVAFARKDVLCNTARSLHSAVLSKISWCWLRQAWTEKTSWSVGRCYPWLFDARFDRPVFDFDSGPWLKYARLYYFSLSNSFDFWPVMHNLSVNVFEILRPYLLIL